MLCMASVCVATSLKLLALLVSCHLIPLPLSCPIQPVWCWGDKKGSANTLVLPCVSGEVSEAYVCFAHITGSRINLPRECVPQLRHLVVCLLCLNTVI